MENHDEKTSQEDVKQKKPKREVISISVTPEEKRKISVEALKDYNTSVSDLIRSRMFIKHDAVPNQEAPTEKEETSESEIYEEVIRQLKAEISELKEENKELKLNADEPTNVDTVEEIEETPRKSNGLYIEFVKGEDEESILEKLKANRAQMSEELSPEELENFEDLEQLTKIILLRGFKRSYNSGYLAKDTGLRLSDVKKAAELEGINYDEQV